MPRALFWMRWVAVAPACYVGGLLGGFGGAILIGGPLKLAERLGLLQWDAPFSLAFAQTLTTLLPTNVGFVALSAWAAPRYRIPTAVGCAVAATILSALRHVLLQYVAGARVGPVNFAHFGGESIGAFLGVLLWLRMSRPKQDSETAQAISPRRDDEASYNART